MTATGQSAPDASAVVSWNVRRLRLAHGWTQEEAGRRLEKLTGTPWSKASWSAAETHSRGRSWTANEVAALSRMFTVTFDDLFAAEHPTPTCPTCGQEVLR
ncbi:helix-turn-helix transcriptional regulator [Streptomyces sp. NPDC005780]|uniref:helix-turn-helix transcriptional regulator n=1 Tax=Streptomyces sp. NPDC005780 TaxID=3364730 RepID=UPI003682731C